MGNRPNKKSLRRVPEFKSTSPVLVKGPSFNSSDARPFLVGAEDDAAIFLDEIR